MTENLDTTRTTSHESSRTVSFVVGPQDNSKLTRTFIWLTAFCVSVTVLLSLSLCLYIIGERSAAEDAALARVDELENEVSCRAKATLESDLAKIDGYLAIIGGLKILIDSDLNGAAENSTYQPTLNELTTAEYTLFIASGARAADLAFVAGLDCPDNAVAPSAPR